MNYGQNIDLLAFDSAWLYKYDGSILRIKERKFDVSYLIVDIEHLWLCQYKEAIDQIDNKKLISDFVLYGVLSSRDILLPLF